MTAFAEGAPCWADAMLPDLEAGKRFYGELFGWTFSDSVPEFGDYTTALLDGRKAAGLLPKKDGRMPTVWGVYFATSDLKGTAPKVREAGGQVISGGTPLGDLGAMMLGVDPGGAVFGAWQAGRHQGFEVQAEPGAYAWMGLSTREPEAVDAFYGDVFGFEGVTEGPMASPTFLPWRIAGQEREIGCRIVLDARAPAELPAHFTVFFLAEEMDAALRTAVRQGGKVLSEPQGTPGGPLALVVDNQGAAFGLMAPK
ncbi:VOC family protein [Streptomyces ochraceiscleroticus]|uniref:VOC family protein n=1 Tax=Streptomyces ochraceiscleroticus TaxID=47761 RepID=A0ABW1MWM2_9ACTN|nr:VOC family protein [Streptomyces ochraceiscleroticus]